jgi:ABC-2 type transport system ATP-binding protein
MPAEEIMPPSLEIKDVRKSFNGFTAVDGVSLSVPAGSVFGLLGPNGAGKTTTIRMIMDIIVPDSGEILLFGKPRGRDSHAAIGYLPEERGLYRKMTVTDHLVFLGELNGRPRRELRPRVAEWLERVDLGGWARSKVEELSKGMQQKIQLIGTFLHEPDLVILDEPFSGLDPINQQLFKELLAEYKGRGKTILLSTHIMEQAEKLCDHVCLISKGKTILQGELRAIKEQMSGNAYALTGDGDGDMSRLRGIAGIEAVHRENGQTRVLLQAGMKGRQVLKEIMEVVAVDEFRSVEPDLEEIFIKAVRDA